MGREWTKDDVLDALMRGEIKADEAEVALDIINRRDTTRVLERLLFGADAIHAHTMKGEEKDDG